MIYKKGEYYLYERYYI